ncbi:sensor domain-containing diguanylate cyclase [Sulfidibacter corallicola]|uniref:diguanylate cyclase n=1 Tax=Sulfidibacter corallicola TaxID=2818388 RepID=A0A8A4TU99_SULCO|nr:sensor domain-containing diguanylate cyclase [Sulfidibacter corallicola]QTD52681.1 sensor domain-containing diguanylate cyclase [Sulfidibacter corallicola]
MLFSFTRDSFVQAVRNSETAVVAVVDLVSCQEFAGWIEYFAKSPLPHSVLLVSQVEDLLALESLPEGLEATLNHPPVVRAKIALLCDLCRKQILVERQQERVRRVEAELQKEIAYHKETERILSENERTLRSIYLSIEATGESVMITDRRNTVYYVNPAFSDLTGFNADEVFDRMADDFFNFDHSPVVLAKMKEIARETGSWQGDVTLRKKSGDLYDAFLDLNSVKDQTGRFEGFIFIQRDITAIKKMMHDLERLARIDALTGLYNRRYFMERFQEEFKRAARYKRSTCLLLMDLDHFKNINDTYGHGTGDRVLERVGVLIEKQMRTSDFAGRYGGEELCIALPETSQEGGMTFADRLRIRIQEEMFHAEDARLFNVTCSIGVVSLISMEKNITHYFACADRALYRAKKLGRNRVESAEM